MREYIAAHAPPGRYFYVYTPDIFHDLPEYQEWQSSQRHDRSAQDLPWPSRTVLPSQRTTAQEPVSVIAAHWLDEQRPYPGIIQTMGINPAPPLAYPQLAQDQSSPIRAAFADSIQGLSISGQIPQMVPQSMYGTAYPTAGPTQTGTYPATRAAQSLPLSFHPDSRATAFETSSGSAQMRPQYGNPGAMGGTASSSGARDANNFRRPSGQSSLSGRSGSVLEMIMGDREDEEEDG